MPTHLSVSSTTCDQSGVKRVIKDEIPKPKASTGITYQHLCELVEAAIDGDARPSLGQNATYNSQLKRIKTLMDALYSGVRLEAWTSTTVNTPAVAAYSLPITTVSVVVTDFTIELWKGLRRFPIADRMEASTLFKALEQGQGIVTPLGSNLAIPDEDFFTDPDPEADAAIVDSILQDREYIVEEEIRLEDSKEPQKYDPSKELKKARPTMEEAGVVGHLKSIQGRVLTIMDASIADKEQRAALKTLINKEFRRQMEKVGRFYLFPNEDSCSDSEE